MNFEWTIFQRGDDRVAIPLSPTMVRLRRMISEEFYDQPGLRPLKRFMEAIFVAGPALVLLALYVPGGRLLAYASVVCLCVASPYWFAPHWLCRMYLERSGYQKLSQVTADDLSAALARA